MSCSFNEQHKFMQESREAQGDFTVFDLDVPAELPDEERKQTPETADAHASVRSAVYAGGITHLKIGLSNSLQICALNPSSSTSGGRQSNWGKRWSNVKPPAPRRLVKF